MHLKGIRFGVPLVKRLGLLNHHEAYRVSWNRHAGFEIHYVIKGDITWELHGRETPLAVSGGLFGIVPANTLHRAMNNKGAPSVRLGIILEKPTPGSVGGTPFSSSDLKRIFRRFRENGGTVRRFSSRLSATLRELSAALSIENATNPDGQLLLRLLTSKLLYETYAALGEPESLGKGLDVVPQIRRWIDTHFAERVTATRLIRMSGYSRSRFFSLFLDDTGMTPNDYLVRVRIERAKRLLAQRDQPISTLAADCGFSTAAAFSSTFRKHVGISPREFRQKLADDTNAYHPRR